MATIQVNPTRMELTKLKKKLAVARRGHKLLKDKRDELMRQFLELVKENMAIREQVEAGILEANKYFVLARSVLSDEILDASLMVPKQEVNLQVTMQNKMSVDVPRFITDTKIPNEEAIYCYGYAFTSSELDDAVKLVQELLPNLLKLAECEKSAQLMSDEIEKTRRRVNALEHVIIPNMQEKIKYIVMKLDESERSTQIRLMKVKDMMLEARYHYSEK
ncbi:MAG: V-type ATP synthase subunit D [Cellulosilyticaceae bacterium]